MNGTNDPGSTVITQEMRSLYNNETLNGNYPGTTVVEPVSQAMIDAYQNNQALNGNITLEQLLPMLTS